MARPVRRRIALPVHQRRRVGAGGGRSRVDRCRGDPHAEAQVRALLAPPRRCRRGSAASVVVRALRRQHRRAGRRPEVVLMTRVRPNALPWLALSALVVVLDQWSKHWVLASLPEYTA